MAINTENHPDITQEQHRQSAHPSQNFPRKATFWMCFQLIDSHSSTATFSFVSQSTDLQLDVIEDQTDKNENLL